MRNVNFLTGLGLASALAAGSAWADEPTEVTAAAPYVDESGFELSIGGGLGLEGEVDTGGPTLDVGEAGIVEGSVAYKFNDRFRAGVVVQYESADINIGLGSADAHLWNVMAFGEVDILHGDDEGLFGRAAFGLSQGDVGVAFGGADLDDGKTFELGGGYRGEIDGHKTSFRGGYVKTSDLSVGGFADVDVKRYQFVFTYALNAG